MPVLWIDGKAHDGKPIDFTDQQKPTRGQAPTGGGFAARLLMGGLLAVGGGALVFWDVRRFLRTRR